jgi:MFS family permease
MNTRSRRNVALLSIALALGMSGGVMIIAIASVAGAMLQPLDGMATVPLAFLFGGTMCSTLPAALLMARVGRRNGFVIGAAFGVTASVISAGAMLSHGFWAFCAGLFLHGVANAFVQQYRFAAAEAVPREQRATAISLVMAGGLAAAVIGPNLASWSRDLVADAPFAGCFAVLMVLQVMIAAVLWFLEMPAATGDAYGAPRRSVRTIVRQPKFIVALIAAALGYAVMNYFMTPTPLAIVGHGHHFDDAMFVIEWHVLGMYAPAFVVGPLIARLGAVAVMAVGALSYVACVVAAVSGTALIANFWTHSVLLGVGWSFCFIGATALLTETHRCGEAASVQGINDFAVFSTVAVASVAAGWIYDLHGWNGLAIGGMPVVLTLGAIIAWLALHERRTLPLPAIALRMAWFSTSLTIRTAYLLAKGVRS